MEDTKKNNSISISASYVSFIFQKTETSKNRYIILYVKAHIFNTTDNM